MIRKSNILTSFIRSEIQRKQIGLDTINNLNDQDSIKINELVKDFYVRWNSTYFMLICVITIQQIINDIAYTTPARIGLIFKQIAAYLDPNTLVNLFDEEISQAESLIISETKALRGKPQQQITTST
ncbi:unnamed protein product [Rotaria sp. Silwood2]|nr:unnamed protein product [Rotaria sp. Silwood2]